MSRDPADVSRAPVDIVRLDVKHVLGGGRSVEEVASLGVDHTFRFTCRSTGRQKHNAAVIIIQKFASPVTMNNFMV